MKIRGAAKTDIGRRRQANEDAFAFVPELALFVVADGVGGRAGGGVASRLAVQVIQQSFESTKDEDLTPVPDDKGNRSLAGRRLLIAFSEANARVLEVGGSEPHLHNMGAAVAAIAFDLRFKQVAVSHVGDTRAYRIRGDLVEQLTQDHTIVEKLLSEGKITAEDVPFHPDRHVLTRALGSEAIVRPSLRFEPLRDGDVLVLCSDGIHDVVESSEILEAIRKAGDRIDEACSRLIELANERGGHDNSTILAVAPEQPTGRS